MGRRDKYEPDRSGRTGSKRHVICDVNGIPLAVRVMAPSAVDIWLLDDVVDAVVPKEPSVSRSLKRRADNGYAWPTASLSKSPT